MKITPEGQVTIPQHIREKFDLLPHTEIEFVMEGERVFIQKVREKLPFEKMRGLSKGQFTTNEMMDLTRK